jgi:hypothetical protein
MPRKQNIKRKQKQTVNVKVNINSHRKGGKRRVKAGVSQSLPQQRPVYITMNQPPMPTYFNTPPVINPIKDAVSVPIVANIPPLQPSGNVLSNFNNTPPPITPIHPNSGLSGFSQPLEQFTPDTTNYYDAVDSSYVEQGPKPKPKNIKPPPDRLPPDTLYNPNTGRQISKFGRTATQEIINWNIGYYGAI